MSLDHYVGKYARLFTDVGIPKSRKIIEVLLKREPIQPENLFAALSEAARHRPQDAYLLGRELGVEGTVEKFTSEVRNNAAFYRHQARELFAIREPPIAVCRGVEYSDTELVDIASTAFAQQDPFVAYAMGRAGVLAESKGYQPLLDAALKAIVGDRALRFVAGLLALRNDDKALFSALRAAQASDEDIYESRVDALDTFALGPTGKLRKAATTMAMQFLTDATSEVKPKPPKSDFIRYAHLEETHGIPADQLRQFY